MKYLNDDLAGDEPRSGRELQTASGDVIQVDFDSEIRMKFNSDQDDDDFSESENDARSGVHESARARVERVREERQLRQAIFDDLYPESD